MLDNMNLEAMTKARQIAGDKMILEASGNVSLDTVRAIAETGVDLISVGAITHSARAVDISMRIEAG
jgi:nicotinate-nucleotide pyrophosphorylase (carboxylating)